VKDVTSAVGSMTGVVGTLAGAYFGVSAGSAGKAKAEKSAAFQFFSPRPGSALIEARSVDRTCGTHRGCE
jgi:hypothetical protein